MLNFAWEDVNHKNSTIKLAKDNLKDTVILVVIGYSFPSYNLEIDKEIITNMGYLEKIYIQTSNKDHDEVKRSVESIHPEYKDLDISVIISNNTDTFLIPPELTMEEEFKPIENFYSK